MIRVEEIIHIEKRPEQVFQFISNFENNPLWQGGMVACTFTTEPPLRVGSRYDQKAKFLGKDIISTFEVIAYQADHLVSAKSIAGSFPIQFTRTVTELNGGARVRALIEGESSGFFRIARPLMQWMVRRSIHRDYQTLKKILEARHY